MSRKTLEAIARQAAIEAVRLATAQQPKAATDTPKPKASPMPKNLTTMLLRVDDVVAFHRLAQEAVERGRLTEFGYARLIAGREKGFTCKAQIQTKRLNKAARKLLAENK